MLLSCINAFSFQWPYCIFISWYTHLNLALLLHRAVLVMFLLGSTVYVSVCQRAAKLQTIKVFKALYFATLCSESQLKGSPEFNPGPQLCRPLTYRDLKHIFGKILCIMTRTRSNDNPVLGVLFSHNLWYDIYVECQILAYRTTREKKHWSIKLSLQIKMMKGITFYWMHKKKLFN